ncbi:MAG: histidine kinase [Pseudomonadota bacterium]
MSLRSRLALLVLGLFMVALLAAAVKSLNDARNDVLAEIAYDQALATRVLTLTLGDVANNPSLAATPGFLGQLMELASALNFDVQVIPAPNGNAYPQFGRENVSPLEAPAWFVSLLAIDEAAMSQEIGNINGDRVFIRTDPFREINEVWRSTSSGFSTRMGALLLFNMIIYLMLGWWLRPVEQIVVGLSEVEKGDFSRRIPMTGLPEFDQISDKINQLTAGLGASKMENERLQSESIGNQEQERLRLAQELHDRLGQSISAIKAMAASIEIRSQHNMPEIAASARQIEDVSEAAYDAVRNLMAWLRPAVLDELGLTKALQQLVDEWNERHENTFCRLRFECELDLDEEQSINIYRIVQEALLNVAKYAQATEVRIMFSGREVISLSIADDGIGFNPNKVKKGRGLWNIQDRVNLLQGKWQLVANPGNGVSMFLEFPRHPDQRKRRKGSRRDE